MAHTALQGSMTGKLFKKYLSDVLLPTLHAGDIVIMDNLRSHRVKGVKEIIQSVKAEVRYLPPYSPDMKPLEKMGAKIKSILRKWRIRDAILLPKALSRTFNSISRHDCLAWFICSGYCNAL